MEAVDLAKRQERIVEIAMQGESNEESCNRVFGAFKRVKTFLAPPV